MFNVINFIFFAAGFLAGWAFGFHRGADYILDAIHSFLNKIEK